MKLYSPAWALTPLLVLAVVWALAAISEPAANTLVETGLLAPGPSSIIPLPGTHGGGLAPASFIIYFGLGCILGPLFTLADALEYAPAAEQDLD